MPLTIINQFDLNGKSEDTLSTENANSRGYQEGRLGLECPGHSLEAKTGMMRRRGHDLDRLNERRRKRGVRCTRQTGRAWQHMVCALWGCQW